jgi:hypothetical protein
VSIIGIVGRSRSGKAGLIKGLIPELGKKGLRVVVHLLPAATGKVKEGGGRKSFLMDPVRFEKDIRVTIEACECPAGRREA